MLWRTYGDVRAETNVRNARVDRVEHRARDPAIVDDVNASDHKCFGIPSRA